MKKNIQFLVTVATAYNKETPEKEIEELAQSVIGKNSCGGNGPYGNYSAKVKAIKLNKIKE